MLQQVKAGSPEHACVVGHFYTRNFVTPDERMQFLVDDCALFKVEHIDRGDVDFSSTSDYELVLEESLDAINSVLTWWRTQREEIQNTNSFVRQIGIADIKYFFIASPDDKLLIVGENASRQTGKLSYAEASLGMPTANMIMTNGSWANPVSPLVRRAMSSQSLVGIGFYTEAWLLFFHSSMISCNRF